MMPRYDPPIEASTYELIPTYMVVRQLGLIDSIWALILPVGVPVWNVLILLNFFRRLPVGLEESAVLDGAGHWTILWKIYRT